ncbi:MAG: pyridoxamine 5'-phosphate oxidase, partial [Bryobacteraceae bacterium]
MNFIGIDLGWQSKASGAALLDWNGSELRLVRLDLLADITTVAPWVEAHAGANAVAGIDAPLVIPNASGMRPADKLAHSRYGRYHAGAYPASRARAYGERTTGFSAELERLGFQHGDRLTARAAGRFQIEVHPHAATVQLFGLDRIVKYKRGTLAERVAGLARLRSLMLERLPRLTPRLLPEGFPEVPASGRELKSAEDRLDAITCAYVAAHWWYWGEERNDVLGDAQTGYIIVPKRNAPALSLAGLRETYTRAGLLESDLDPNPIAQFEKWFAEARAAGIKEPNAMTLATASADGQPSARIVLLKGVDESGFVFYTNYQSRKGKELTENPQAALVFYWAKLERQVRVTGSIEKTSRAESEAYWNSRPRGSRLGAVVSRQSAVIASRDVLDRALEKFDEPADIPLPAQWGGFR